MTQAVITRGVALVWPLTIIYVGITYIPIVKNVSLINLCTCMLLHDCSIRVLNNTVWRETLVPLKFGE